VRRFQSGQTIAGSAETDIAAPVEADIATEGGLLPRLRTLEDRTVVILRVISLPLLRLAIGAVFIWFGALKIADATPVADFVANTLPWFNRAWVVLALGTVECFAHFLQ